MWLDSVRSCDDVVFGHSTGRKNTLKMLVMWVKSVRSCDEALWVT